MSTTKRQSRKQREGGRVLSMLQETQLLSGFGFGPGPDFESPAAMEQAWYQHRDRLLAEAPVFHRPHSYWTYEALYTPQNGEDQRDVLLRMNLPLTPQEQAILRKEGITV